ncbi:phosphoglycerate kinase [Striga asiatica]|uniref:Phosphoglycerate kinase n=1 Tax=Striga asiatica TaxID=4170 RepID=A0A5A7Q9K1_STRAF|nr:phosphoglycerate kinase [Striga asiatica]
MAKTMSKRKIEIRVRREKQRRERKSNDGASPIVVKLHPSTKWELANRAVEAENPTNIERRGIRGFVDDGEMPIHATIGLLDLKLRSIFELRRSTPQGRKRWSGIDFDVVVVDGVACSDRETKKNYEKINYQGEDGDSGVARSRPQPGHHKTKPEPIKMKLAANLEPFYNQSWPTKKVDAPCRRREEDLSGARRGADAGRVVGCRTLVGGEAQGSGARKGLR